MNAPSPFTPTPPQRRTWLRRAAIAMALVVLAGIGVWSYPAWMCGGPRSGIALVDGECVGVTDGAFVFDQRFDAIQERIKAENDRVAEQGRPHVRVALLTTLTPTDVSPLDASRVRSALEGAYVAQMRANHGVEFGDRLPLVQLYLANEGSRQEQWEPVARRLAEMTADDEAPLVAVIGMGVSITATADAAHYFSAKDIPMVSAVVTADGLDHDAIPGLLRASPSNTDYVTALRAYIEEREELESGILVYDSNEPDLFVSTLRTAYERELPELLRFPPQPFRGSTMGDDVRAGLFDAVTRNICTAGPDVVVYAGRTHDLHGLVDALSVRVCRDEPLTLVFSVTGLSVLEDEEALAQLEDGNITIAYASATDPGWSRDLDAAPEHFPAFLAAYEDFSGRSGDALADGYAVMHHDAMATAVGAIRIAQPAEGQELLPSHVLDALLLLQTEHSVPGASGTLSFSQTRGGNPGGKVIPVIEVAGPQSIRAAEGEPYITPLE
ncbi:ABC-type branched-subunit amino acid transport system substrate-binding protein [Nocardiopsis mwathae]|uniref:ABC-type branched-subunit amino acid transport system substrate-binding protein n=1 Tax=Nocardiopsis mwathae TaxID=1472723 RepID=A0A7W9YG45_9ACTN|nr:ABC transporter substrate-binding protein [Nocardiopsis mwathae]MBB6171535.1 ABC-type branched-subunit amino acid transport system substrate-binding protein [Nocardiopsis mwathae]